MYMCQHSHRASKQVCGCYKETEDLPRLNRTTRNCSLLSSSVPCCTRHEKKVSRLSSAEGKELNDVQRNLLDIEILSNLRFSPSRLETLQLCGECRREKNWTIFWEISEFREFSHVSVSSAEGKELNDFQRNSLDIEILSNLRFGSLEIRDTSVTTVTNKIWGSASLE